jgi:hypothetical protein
MFAVSNVKLSNSTPTLVKAELCGLRCACGKNKDENMTARSLVFMEHESRIGKAMNRHGGLSVAVARTRAQVWEENQDHCPLKRNTCSEL